MQVKISKFSHQNLLSMSVYHAFWNCYFDIFDENGWTYDINTVMLRCLFSCLSKVLWTYFLYWPIRTHFIVLEHSFLSFIFIFSGDQNYFYFQTFEKMFYFRFTWPESGHLTLSLSNSFVIILTFIRSKALFLPILNNYRPELRTQDLRMDCTVVQRG